MSPSLLVSFQRTVNGRFLHLTCSGPALPLDHAAEDRSVLSRILGGQGFLDELCLGHVALVLWEAIVDVR